jgi:hypothetical protein
MTGVGKAYTTIYPRPPSLVGWFEILKRAAVLHAVIDR